MSPLFMDANNQVITSRDRHWQQISKSIKAMILVGNNLGYFLSRSKRGLANLKRGKYSGAKQFAPDKKEASLKQLAAFHNLNDRYFSWATVLWRQYDGKGKGLLERVFKKQLSLKQAYDLLRQGEKTNIPPKGKKVVGMQKYKRWEKLSRSLLEELKDKLDVLEHAQLES